MFCATEQLGQLVCVFCLFVVCLGFGQPATQKPGTNFTYAMHSDSNYHTLYNLPVFDHWARNNPDDWYRGTEFYARAPFSGLQYRLFQGLSARVRAGELTEEPQTILEQKFSGEDPGLSWTGQLLPEKDRQDLLSRAQSDGLVDPTKITGIILGIEVKAHRPSRHGGSPRLVESCRVLIDLNESSDPSFKVPTEDPLATFAKANIGETIFNPGAVLDQYGRMGDNAVQDGANLIIAKRLCGDLGARVQQVQIGDLLYRISVFDDATDLKDVRGVSVPVSLGNDPTKSCLARTSEFRVTVTVGPASVTAAMMVSLGHQDPCDRLCWSATARVIPVGRTLPEHHETK